MKLKLKMKLKLTSLAVLGLFKQHSTVVRSQTESMTGVLQVAANACFHFLLGTAFAHNDDCRTLSADVYDPLVVKQKSTIARIAVLPSMHTETRC